MGSEREAHEVGIRQRAVLVGGSRGRLRLCDGIELLHEALRDRSVATRERARHRCAVLLRAFEAEKWLDSFTPADVEWFAARRIEGHGVSPNTVVQHDLQVLSQVFRLAHKRGLLPKEVLNPVPLARLPKLVEPGRPFMHWNEALEIIAKIRSAREGAGSLPPQQR